jgi:hypothetical protein
MNNEQKLRELIRELIKNELNEISTTGNIAGYLTPNAFAGDKHDSKKRIKDLARKIGYTLTNRGSLDTKPGDKLQESLHSLQQMATELNENYYAYRNDATKLPHQKIGEAISQINRQLKTVEKALRYNDRLKNEYGISNEALWKRTQNQMTRLEGKLIELARRIREMRG